jgi:branched-chain amino acid transport system substrate-binding protein
MRSLLHMRGVAGLAKLALAFVACLMFLSGASAQDKQPIKIGFGMALTGPLGPLGKSALLSMKIWEEETNKNGGLIGRPVQLIYYDDQSNPSTVPGIYTKLLEVDKVDLVVGGYATNMLAPAMPIIMRKKMAFVGLFGLDVNHNFKYDRYFAMIPSGPEPQTSFTKGFFDTAMAQSDKPTTVAIVAADAEFSKNAADGARANAKAHGLKVVYDKSYPPSTADFAPIVRAIQATNPDLVVICSYPLDSVGMVLAANEANLKPKMIGGAMVGLQSTVFKTKLGPALNGWVNYDFWLPSKALMFPGTAEFLQTYQERAAKEGVDPLGYYMGPFAYSYIDVLGQAVNATKSLDQTEIADHIRKTTFKTLVGDVAFAPNGEWAKSRVLQVQFRGIKGNGVDQFKDPSTQVIITPTDIKSGDVVYPYEKAKNM